MEYKNKKRERQVKKEIEASKTSRAILKDQKSEISENHRFFRPLKGGYESNFEFILREFRLGRYNTTAIIQEKPPPA
jgi:hypothetical protein